MSAKKSVDLSAVMATLRTRTSKLRFSPPVAYVYNPLDYAWPVAKAYCDRWGKGKREVLFLGMNPGPFGMGQTGVPFGEIAIVRDYLRLDGAIGAPARFHEKRPVLGFSSSRSEVSGKRLWGAFRERFPEAEDFFVRSIVLNYCPLLFLSESGANLTPDKLVRSERTELEAICDRALAEAVAVLQPKHIVGVGAYAAKRAALVTGREIVTMPHPSPASPAANKDWAGAARRALESAGLVGLL